MSKTVGEIIAEAGEKRERVKDRLEDSLSEVFGQLVSTVTDAPNPRRLARKAAAAIMGAIEGRD